MIKVRIQDGSGSPQEAHVTSEGALLISEYTCPPLLPQKCKIFRGYLETAAGSNDMGIDGSAPNETEFFIAADDTNDIYIAALSFEMTMGTQPQMWEFADSNAALNNGCRLWYERVDGIVYIHDNMVDNWTFIRLCGGIPTISSGVIADAFITRHVGAANDFGLIPTLDLRRFMPPFGIKLDRGTVQRLVFEVRDNCTDADTFNIIAYGFERMP